MKAIVYTQYGSPDGLELREVDKPVPQDDQVLVRVRATAVNPLDWHTLRGQPFLIRLTEGLFKPKSNVLGVDFAGLVEAVGASITKVQPGDAVYGGCVRGLAEYVTVREKSLALKPANITFEEAAAVPVAAVTALQALRDKGQVQARQHVLINGASGGVGTYAVQIAKAFDATVTGVCSTRNLDLVLSLGADHVIDYTHTDFTRDGQRYDLIIDNVGNYSVADYKRALQPAGICVVVGFTTMQRMIPVMVLGALTSRTGTQKISSLLANINEKDLSLMSEWLATGQVKSVIDRCYPLSEAAAALAYLETGRARGKVVVTQE